jgi:hypothetical protein
MKSETVNDNRIVLVLQNNPLALVTSTLDGSEVHKVLLDFDAAISLSGALLVCAQHARLAETGRLQPPASTGTEQARSQPMFVMRPPAGGAN